MKRLVIAVDCDDVLLPSLGTAVGLYNQKYGTSLALKDVYNPHAAEWGVDPNEINQRIHEIVLSDEYSQIVPFSDAIEVCQKLSQQAHELHLVTARSSALSSVTEHMLENYFKGIFSAIEHVGIDGNKGEVCQRIGADVLIDDNEHHLIAAFEKGVINLLRFGDYPWQNRSSASNVSLIDCRDWFDVEAEIERIATS